MTDGDISTSEVLTSSSSSSTSSGTGPSSTSSSSSTAGGGDAYTEETGPYDNYGYGNYESYYDESTASPDGDTSRRVTITSSVDTGSELDLGAGGKIDVEAGTGGGIITSGVETSVAINSNKTSLVSIMLTSSFKCWF